MQIVAIIVKLICVTPFTCYAIRIANLHSENSLDTFKYNDLCNPITDNTRSIAKFVALHKMGTYLHNRGAQCIGQYYKRANIPAAVSARGICHNLEGEGEDLSIPKLDAARFDIMKEVHWTRDPFDWVISNYLYHKRGDESLTCWQTALRDPTLFGKLRDLRPSIPALLDNETTYTEYLRRINEEDGLVSELFRMSGSGPHCEATLQTLLAEAVATDVRIPVCLESFMQQTSYLPTWHMILENIGGGHGDSDLDECLVQNDPSSIHLKHSTSWDVSFQDHRRMQSSAKKMDASLFKGIYADAAQKIGCGKSSLESSARLFSIERMLA